MLKTLFNKWYLVAAATVLTITGLGISSIPVTADAPAPVYTGNLVVGGQYTPGILGTEMDIMINGGPDLPGWCVNETVDIYVNQRYTADLYNYLDYFGESYPANVGSLPSAITTNTATGTTINWPAVAYIINNKAAGWNWYDVQKALWYFSDGDTTGLTANAQTMVSAAQTYLSAHNGVYIPGSGQLEPIICYALDSSPLQIIFYEYTVPTPPIVFNTQSLPGVTGGIQYSQTISASGGTGNFSWAIASGALPAGLALNGDVISGTPTAAGKADFNIGVKDDAGNTATQALSITVTAPVWDIVGNHICNVQDLITVGNDMGEHGAPGWVPEDVNQDGVVNVLDLIYIGNFIGQSW
jgi:Putative Ig domain